jgi:hypothetical protein
LSAAFTATAGAGWVGSFGAGGSGAVAEIAEPAAAIRLQKIAQQVSERIEVCLARDVSGAIPFSLIAGC